MEKAFLVDHAKIYGRSRLSDFSMGMVRTIVENNGTMQRVGKVVKALNEVQLDDSLPWSYEDAKIAPTPIVTCHDMLYQCTDYKLCSGGCPAYEWAKKRAENKEKAPTPIGTEKMELLNDSTTTWNLEAIMRNEGVSNV